MATINPDTGVFSLGMGFNSLLGRSVPNTAIDTTTKKIRTIDSVDLEYLVITQRSQLRDFLNISAGMHVGFLLGSADSRVNFEERFEINDYNFYCAAKLTLRTISEGLTSSPLLSDAIDGANGDPHEFKRVYGDEFISDTVFGGELLLLIEVRLKDSSHRNTLAVGFDAGGLVFHGSADVARGAEKLQAFSSITARVHSRGLLEDLPDPADVNAAKTYILDFPKRLKADIAEKQKRGQEQTLLQVETTSYTQARNKPSGLTFLTLDKERQFLDRTMKLRDEALQLSASTSFALAHPFMFEIFNRDEVGRISNQSKQLVQELFDRAAYVYNNLELPVEAEPVIPQNPLIQKLPDKITFRMQVNLWVWFLPSLPFPFNVPPFDHVFPFAFNLGNNNIEVGSWQWAGDTRYPNLEIRGITVRDLACELGRFSPETLGLEYMAHLDGIADTEWTQAPGTLDRGARVEGVAFRLSGFLASEYTVQYVGYTGMVYDFLPAGRMQDPNIAGRTTGIFQDGQFCGTRGKGNPLQALAITIVRRSPSGVI